MESELAGLTEGLLRAGTQSPIHENTLAGNGASDRVFGHLGFTGTSIWIDSACKFGYTLLTNATKDYWYAKKDLNQFRKNLGGLLWQDESYLILFLALFTSALHAQIAVVSDLDETIKRTGSRPDRVLRNILFTQKIYAGMDDLFKEMRLYTDDLFIVTAQPKLSRFNIEKLIRKQISMSGRVYTRNFLEDSLKYKVDSIKDILSKGYKKVILIGDDTSKDAKVYDRIKKAFPDHVLSIYIHQVKNNDLPSSATPYFTAYDLALNEARAGRMIPVRRGQ